MRSKVSYKRWHGEEAGEKYEMRNTKCEVSKAIATAQDGHTYRMFNVKYLMFNVSVGQFLSPLVGRNNIGRGISPKRCGTRG